MKNLWNKVTNREWWSTILHAAPAQLTAAGVVVSIGISQLRPFLPGNPAVGWVVGALAATGTVLTVAVAIVRRVTPVLDKAKRGVLPPDSSPKLGPTPPEYSPLE
ncbi:MAG: hypothetical protein AAGF73_06075 [Actinomycetota bacterium]